jgi:D-psicose/D-tagatose/L-ribulose 3-epimerase
MRYGVNTWVWASPLDDATLAELIPRVAGMGFDWIELPIENQHEFDPQTTSALLREHGLGVSLCAAMSPHRDLIAEDEVVRSNGAQYVRHCIETAQVLGAQNVVGPLYSAVGRTWQMTPEERERDTELLVGTLRELAAHAQEHGVTLCVEPLNRFETSFINLVAQGVELVDRVDHAACQLMLDTFHMNIEERSLGEAIRLAGPRVRHVHTCENDRGAPGTGHVPWQEVADALRAIDYDGPLVIESFTAKVKSIARAAAIWRPLAATQDDLARDGLAFLKQLF